MAFPSVSCGQCRFFQRTDTHMPNGECRLNPPIRVSVDQVSSLWDFPVVDTDDWCGQWQRRSEMTPEEAERTL